MSEAGESFWATLPLGRGVALLHRDPRGLAALAKPPETLSHPNSPGDEGRALLRARYDLAGEFYEWPGADGDGRGPTPGAPSRAPAPPRRLWLLNRLDAAASGVILVAADGALAAAIQAQFKRREVGKVYRALVFGAPRPPVQVWRDLLAVQKGGGRIRTSAAGGIPAESRMTIVRAGRQAPPLTLLGLEPRTGRSHQLRVQCAKRGLPIVGDQTYGDFRRNREFAKLTRVKRLFLHSLETSFTYEWSGGTHAFSARAPLPPEFEEFL